MVDRSIGKIKLFRVKKITVSCEEWEINYSLHMAFGNSLAKKFSVSMCGKKQALDHNGKLTESVSAQEPLPGNSVAGIRVGLG